MEAAVRRVLDGYSILGRRMSKELVVVGMEAENSAGVVKGSDFRYCVYVELFYSILIIW